VCHPSTSSLSAVAEEADRGWVLEVVAVVFSRMTLSL
jgi:hypothetical protein